MFTIYLILQFLVSAKEILISPNEFNIVDTFQDFGIILGANITYLSQNSHQCNIIKQKLINSEINEILVVPKAQEPFFESNFIDGALNKQFDQNYILSMVPISAQTIVAVILFNNGNLAYIQDDNNKFIFVDTNYSIQIEETQLKNPVYMFYLQTTQQILIILHKQLIKISINLNNPNIFESSFKLDDGRFLTTQNILLVENLLFIAGGKELVIYSIDQDIFQKVNNSKFTLNFIDIKVFFENGFYKIFSLHRKYGVTIFSYDPKIQAFNQTQPNLQISQQGYLIGVYYNILMIVDEQENESIVYEYHYQQNDDSWRLFASQKSQKKIKDIEFTEHYAILIGSNGHEIIYHSLPAKEFQMKNQIIIPGLQSLYLLNQTESQNQSLIGITRYTFFASYFYLSPQKIRCHNIDTSTPMQFIYYQNSTQCSELLQKEEGKICLYISNYTINYIQPYFTSEYKIQFQICFIFIVVVSLLFFLIKKYKARKPKSQKKSKSTPVYLLIQTPLNLNPNDNGKQNFKNEKIEKIENTTNEPQMITGNYGDLKQSIIENRSTLYEQSYQDQQKQILSKQ